jgi:(2Fe-2S) ferredoxin
MVADAFKEELKIGVGETTADKLFTLRKVECLGSCTTAPVCQINDDYFENLTRDKIREIVEDLKAARVPRHISNGPTLDGGKCGYKAMVEACPQGR